MIRSTTDHYVFYHHSSTRQCIDLVVSVDDIVITSSNQDSIQKLKQHLFSHFQTKDLRKLKYFLGIEVAHSNFRVIISQRKYVFDILTDTGMLDCKPVDTPMDLNVKLVLGKGELLRELVRYRRLAGKLNYLTITQPDISFPVSVVVSFYNHLVIVSGMLQFIIFVMSKELQVKGCCMRTKVIPRLLATVMQTGQVHPQINVLHQGIVCLLEVT